LSLLLKSEITNDKQFRHEGNLYVNIAYVSAIYCLHLIILGFKNVMH